MAQARSLSHGKFRVWIETSPGSNSFSERTAAFTDKDWTLNNQTADQIIPDDTDADAILAVNRIVTQQDWQFSGRGVVNMNDVNFWRTWVVSGIARQVRIEFSDSGANGGGYFQGAAVPTKWNGSSQRGDKAQISIDIASAGSFTWVGNA